jgi:alkanesulfonate monooxygenase SsuD/methylene tetrahydromethanopterin reductase-like flavin-dependent oxidoreductase (luciferase family)
MGALTTDRRVRFGFILDMSKPERWGGPRADFWRDLVRFTGEAEELGYDAVWIGEHHFTDDAFGGSPLQIAAAIAVATTRIAIGTYVLLLPFHHPLRVAEEAAAVDLLSDGRLELGLGLGYRDLEMKAYDVPRATRVKALNEGVALIKQAWGEGEIEVAGREPGEVYSVTPKPIQRPHPPLWYSVRSETAARRSARHGAHAHLLGGRSILRYYLDEVRSAGGDPAAMRFSVYRPFFITEDPAGDRQRWAEHFSHFGRRHGTWVGGNQDTSYDSEIGRKWSEDALTGMNYLFGTPDEALEGLKQYYLRKPFTDYIAPVAPPWDMSAVRRSYELMARDVIPRFREWLVGQPAPADAVYQQPEATGTPS